MLTAQTRIRIKAPLPLPRKRELTGDTKIRLSQIADLREWVEDRRIYKPGEISEATGLQKQPDGSWKEPKRQQKTRTLYSRAQEETKTAEIEKPAELTEEQKKQTKEIETRINATGWFKHPSTLDEMHPEAAAVVEKQCNKMFQEFPQLKGFIEGLKIRPFPPKEAKAYAKCDATGKSAYIVFNQDYFSDKKILDDKYNESVQNNYYPEGTTSDSIVVHELAHCMCDYIAAKKSIKFEDCCREIVIDVFKEYQAEGLDFDVDNGLCEYPGDMEACPIPEIQMAELIATAYSEYKCSESPRKMARYVGRRLEGGMK